MSRHILLLAAGLSLTACQTTEFLPLMPHSPEFVGLSNHYPITLNKGFWLEDKLNVSVGPFSVSNMDISWQTSTASGTSIGIDKLGYNDQSVKNEQSFSYQLNSSAGNSQSRCRQSIRSNEQSWSFNAHFSLPLNFDASYSYHCQFGAASQTWQLLILADNYGKAEFQLYDQSNNHYEIRPVNYDLMPIPHRTFIGFELLKGTEKLAAVAMNEPGDIWINQALPQAEQDLLVNALLNLWFFKHALDKNIN
ncbi:hypothetical protein [Pseudoalteromonas tunicata]|jgi:hypothetical protein|uniref:Uncharacterized protein n=1 Tax=Pseudoalteromonas tunicata D2 TaxID=87626 RepID=A4C7R5_9GAMM|nr:hypothetical protein [Pseudoalteromonas tunicata]ATC93136.1 hypothetical protein PTUN_a0325 [Pseudoalteromonas tunicata]AXT32208.1 hypothetical protein D1819_16185 [Pseudoalteromonas tunicata]EAR28630.1 hypothetical protein PTD2_06299 [Pseudoalteromonas tunicata D2]